MAATRISGFPMHKNRKYYFCQLFLVLLQDQEPIMGSWQDQRLL